MIYSTHPSRFRAHEFQASLDPSNGTLLLRDISDPRNALVITASDTGTMIEMLGRCEVTLHSGMKKIATKGIQLVLPPKGMQFVVRDVMDYSISGDSLIGWDSFHVLERNQWITVRGIDR